MRTLATATLLWQLSPAAWCKEIKGFTLYINLPPASCSVGNQKSHLPQCKDRLQITVTNMRPQASEPSAACQPPADSGEALPPMQERIVSRVMPDTAARNNAWLNNGACHGISKQDYFRNISSKMARFKTPNLFKTPVEQIVSQSEVINQITAINEGLNAQSLVLVCAQSAKFSQPILTDVRLCYDDRGNYNNCPSSLRSNCPAIISVIGTP